MEDKYYKEEEGLLLTEILKVTFKKKLLIALTTVITTVLLFLLVAFIYNPYKQTYSSTFKIEFLGSDTGKYPDGSIFKYEDIITLENLTAVKESDSKYSTIDVDKMSDNGDITIYRTFDVIDDKSYFEGFYGITVKAKYFSDYYQARDFIDDLVKSPLKKYESIVNNLSFVANLEGYKDSNNYEDQLNFLDSQKKFILGRLETMIGTYTGNFMSQGKRIDDHYIDIYMDFQNSRYNVLATDLEVNGYVKEKDETYKRKVELEIYGLEIEKEDNDKTITNLKAQITELVGIYGSSQVQVFESFNEKISSLTVRNVEIERRLKELNAILDNIESTSSHSITGNQEAFEAQMKEYYEKLVTYTDLVTLIIKDVYTYEQTITYKNVSIIVSDGTISPIIAIIGGVVLGFGGGCVLSLIIGMPKYLKEKKEKEVEASK